VADDDSDITLIDGANRGDADAFERLYRRHRDWVATVAYRYTGDRDEAADVMQDTFAYWFAKFPGFVLTARTTTFLYPVIKNLCVDRLRKRQVTVDIDALADVLPAPDSPTSSDVHRYLQGLAPSQREVVLLRFVDDLSLAQIGEMLGIPLGTVKSRLHNALRALKDRA
jgi:RNA polymerase sigma-70 factor (ECF subfamily)